MLAIKNNIMAGNAARHLGRAYDNLAKSVERLASGLRINSAKDDAAGLAVRELIRADVAVLQQGARNASDGISMLQTMEGAMAVIDDNLIRMMELAEQAATGSYSEAQRTIMNNEFDEMAAEIDRIAGATAFNAIRMLTEADSTEAVEIHVGTTEVISVARQDMRTQASGLNIAVGTAGYEAVSDYGTSNTSDAWLTLTESEDVVGQLQLSITFTGEEAITVNFSASAGTGDPVDTSYTLTEVVEAINAVALNQAVGGDGTVHAYTMASAEHNSTDGKDYLKLVSRTSTSTGLTMIGDSIGTTGADLVGTLGLVIDEDEAALNFSDTDTSAVGGRMTLAAGTGINISNVTNAAAALTAINTAIGTKDTARAAFGYKMNRLESTIAILNIQAENLMAAESRISDVDVATEMATLTRTQVLSQAGIAMLAQANSMPQMALTLLR